MMQLLTALSCLILLNGKVWTENPAAPEAEAVAIEGEHIQAVGPSEQIKKLAGPNCKVIDLQGAGWSPASMTPTCISSVADSR